MAVPPPPAEWAFFSSPGSFEVFSEKWDCRPYKLAAIGTGTGDVIRKAGYTVWTPQFSDTRKAAEEFASHVKPEERVLSPIGNKSLRRLNGLFPHTRLVEYVCYRTEAKAHIPEYPAQYMVFTSPSNAEAYLAQYMPREDACAVAMGPSTCSTLQKHAWRQIVQPAKPEEESIWEAIKAHAGIS